MSFQQGVSGLNAASRNLDVIGNNVANSSTVGAKSARAEFADVYARAAASSGVNIGLGVSVAAVAQQFAQGSISTTDNPLDVAINGNGFFQLQDPNGLVNYGRNGQFKVDREGYIVTAQSMKLLGHPILAQTGMVAGQAEPLRLPTAGIKPSATANVTLEVNLDSRELATFTGANPPVDFNIDSTYNNSTSLKIFDAKGQAVSLTYFFQKSASDTWNLYAAANEQPLNPDGSNLPQPIAELQFGPDGSTLIAPVNPLVVDIPATGAGTAAASQPILGVKVDLAGLTQYGSVFGPTDVAQDGFAPGRMTSVTVEADGTLVASYSSGQSAPVARIELATFRNVQGLQSLGGNAWAATRESGDPVLGVPGGGNLGLLESKSVEESNVDLTAELVNMMVAQRVYQANAQTIKTQDSVMQTLVNLR